MPDVFAEILLRPSRIGFLVRPTDIASVRKVMRICACLWGGTLNPIIPVFTRPPAEWKPKVHERFKGSAIARGYVRFFEPDVYVETDEGLLEQAGLAALRQKHAIYRHVITLSEFFSLERGENWAEPRLGLNIVDALRDIYKTEQRFVLRHHIESVLVKPERGSALTESVFGAYPTSSEVAYIQKAYEDVFTPESVVPNPDTWRRVFLKGAQTPLRATRHGIDTERYWYHDLILFVFDPSRATDLIDLWNLRLEPRPVVPIPIGWFEPLADDIYFLLKTEHRPVVGNPHGVMHHGTIEFGRSISEEEGKALTSKLKPGLPRGALSIKHWRNSVWIDHRDDHVRRDSRLKVVAKEQRTNLAIEDGWLRTTFETMAPEFASPYGRGDQRWVNVLRISSYGDKSIAAVLPFNTFDRSWPKLAIGEDVSVGSEGWVFPGRYNSMPQSVSLLSTDDAITGSLAQRGIKCELSEPGHIAKQMLEHLGGLWGVYLLADIDTLKLLNKMAGGLRRKRNDDDSIEEHFGLRTAPLKDWIDLVEQRKARKSLPRKSLASFTNRNVIRLGLDTECPNCHAKNWSTLTAVDYRIVCERCLKPYDFPQADLLEHNRNWSYRVVGPFSVPDYGRGAYGALLALRVLNERGIGMGQMTFATAMNLRFDNVQSEVDFIAWRSDERPSETHRPPQLIIGEAKSLGSGELITMSELTKLKTIAAKLPESVVVIAVLRDHFTVAEKRILTKFVSWGRRVSVYGEPTNPVVLLTSNELTMDHHVYSTWKAIGGEYAKFADYEHTRALFNLADATQQIYLGMPSFHKGVRSIGESVTLGKCSEAKGYSGTR